MSIMMLPGAWAHLGPKGSGIVTGCGMGQWLAWTMCIERDQWGLTPVLLIANLNQCSQACYQPELPTVMPWPGQPLWPSACSHPHGDAWFPELGLPLLPSGLPCFWGKPGVVEASVRKWVWGGGTGLAAKPCPATPWGASVFLSPCPQGHNRTLLCRIALH